MNTNDFDLASLLAPVRIESFLEDAWEKQPFDIHREAALHYSGLFSLADVDTVIAFGRPRFTPSGALGSGPPLARHCVQGWLPEQMPADSCVGIGELRQLYA